MTFKDTAPEKIKVSGFPFHLQGWNNIYHKVIMNDEITYRLDPYTLYYIFPIIGTTIFKRNGRWVLEKDYEGVISEKISNKTEYICGSQPQSDLVSEEDEQETPFGNWSYGLTVVPIDN